MKAWAVMRRDLLKQSRNPMTIITSVMMPIVYLVIMGNAFHGELKNLSLAVVSQDDGPYGRRVVWPVRSIQFHGMDLPASVEQESDSPFRQPFL